MAPSEWFFSKICFLIFLDNTICLAIIYLRLDILGLYIIYFIQATAEKCFFNNPDFQWNFFQKNTFYTKNICLGKHDYSWIHLHGMKDSIYHSFNVGSLWTFELKNTSEKSFFVKNGLFWVNMGPKSRFLHNIWWKCPG